MVPDKEMLGVALAKAADLAAGPTETLSMIRKLFWASTTNSLTEHLAMENQLQAIAGASSDAREGRLAFVEKRKPVFKGEQPSARLSFCCTPLYLY